MNFETPPSNPFHIFQDWLTQATQTEPSDPNAMCLATIGQDGTPNMRVVLLKSVDAHGFVFYSNTHSTKGRELLLNAHVSLCFHWKTIQRQIRICGMSTPLTKKEADAYFATRPRKSQIGAWASQQSRPLESRFALETEVDKFTKIYDKQEIPRPPHWSGWRVSPLSIEFWQKGDDRLHDRIIYQRTDIKASWKITRLFP